MRVEIVDISSRDAFSDDKKELVGQKGTFITTICRGEYNAGKLYFDNKSVLGSDEPRIFHRVKTKPIYDA